jgi:hypothetical protein
VFPACMAVFALRRSPPSAHMRGMAACLLEKWLVGRVCMQSAFIARTTRTRFIELACCLPPQAMLRHNLASPSSRDMLRCGRGIVARATVCRASSGVSNHGGGAYAAATHVGAWERNTDSTASTSGRVGGWDWVGRAPLMTRAHCAAAAAPIPVRASRPRHQAIVALALEIIRSESGLCGTQTYDEVLEQMSSLKLTPNVHTYAILMANYGKAGRFGQVRVTGSTLTPFSYRGARFPIR